MFRTYTSETPRDGTPLTGSSNAGGGSYVSTSNPVDIMGGALHFFREYGSREEASYFNTRGLDHQHKPPKWMEWKDVAVDGTPLTQQERRADGFWEKKYERELAIGTAIANTKLKTRFEQDHSLWGSISSGLRRLGLKEQLSEKHAVRQALQDMEDRGLEETVVASASAPGGGRGNGPSPSAAWDALIVSVDTNRPLAKVAQEYRPKVDFYGVDPFLDSAPSFIWFSAKIGMFLGLAQGTAKTLSVVNVDAQYLRASGIGILSLLNVTVFASVLKWGGNVGLSSCAFILGDRLATAGKRHLYPEHDATQRSVSNYVCGLSMAFGTVGTLPWWLLNDVRFAVRLGVGAMCIGACLGVFVGSVMDRLVALNIGQLDASNRDMRRFEALMKRERIWMEHLAKKEQDSTKLLLF
mmetsp:Transcript_63982/g.74419  ORF Transcript_63982/g.74419 Transcript_63982/m.74419 type:complete len:410 (-) Transcript_63982:7-1236(-)